MHPKEKSSARQQLRRRVEDLVDQGVTDIVRSRRRPAAEKPSATAATEKPVSLGTGSPQLQAIRNEIGDCTRCKLHQGRTNLVYGVGNPKAKLMLVGEGPGRDEDLQGEPFVGRSGQLLTKMIEAMGIPRADVYIANIVKCLRYNAMIQLGDGSWERIGRLVRKKYSGTVMSVDAMGRIVARRVTGWHATPLADRSVYRLSYQSAKMAGVSKIGIQLTGDHPVLTERGYVEVENLKSDDRIAVGQGLSDVVSNLIYGSLLGDGHIAAKQGLFSFSHSQNQEEYALFKSEILKGELGCSIDRVKVAAGGDQLYPIVKCYTGSHRSLRHIREEFYCGRKKRVPAQLEKNLTPMMLAFWFMDDGHMRIRPPRRPSAEIATCAFSDEDLKILVLGIQNLGLKPHILRNRIQFDVHESKKLSQLIAPYIPPSMRYKLRPEEALRIPFDRSLFKSGQRRTMFDTVEAEKIDLKGTDKTFYCIDVEETNNFVTSGGVVHNCRPPDNRYPEPEEVETCIPFLFKQIEAVGPKVIITLGNLATQTLLKTKVGITTLHGNFQDLNGIQVMPTYHPAFLLRNPNMKKPCWEDLKKVIALLKTLS